MSRIRRNNRPRKTEDRSLLRAILQSRPRVGRSTLQHADKRLKLRRRAARREVRRDDN